MSNIALPVSGATFIGALALTAKSVQKEGLDPLGRQFEPYLGSKNAKALQTGAYATLTLLSLAILSSQSKGAPEQPAQEAYNGAQAGHATTSNSTFSFSTLPSINLTSTINQAIEYAQTGAGQVSKFLANVVDLAESAGVSFVKIIKENPIPSFVGLLGLTTSVCLLGRRYLPAFRRYLPAFMGGSKEGSSVTKTEPLSSKDLLGPQSSSAQGANPSLQNPKVDLMGGRPGGSSLTKEGPLSSRGSLGSHSSSGQRANPLLQTQPANPQNMEGGAPKTRYLDQSQEVTHEVFESLFGGQAETKPTTLPSQGGASHSKVISAAPPRVAQSAPPRVAQSAPPRVAQPAPSPGVVTAFADRYAKNPWLIPKPPVQKPLPFEHYLLKDLRNIISKVNFSKEKVTDRRCQELIAELKSLAQSARNPQYIDSEKHQFADRILKKIRIYLESAINLNKQFKVESELELFMFEVGILTELK